MTRKECYRIFEFDDNVVLSEQLIKSKYRELSKKYHPDNPNGNVDKLRKVNDAYEVLMNRKFDDFETSNSNSSDYQKVYNMYKNANYEANHYKNLYNNLKNNTNSNERYTAPPPPSAPVKQTKTGKVWRLLNADLFSLNKGLKAIKTSRINSEISFLYIFDKFLFITQILFCIVCVVSFIALATEGLSGAFIIGSIAVIWFGNSAINSFRRSIDSKIQILQYKKSRLL